MSKSTAVIIVTHNSGKFFGRCMSALAGQSVSPDSVIVIDSGSSDTQYLVSSEISQEYSVDYCENIGFCSANNRAWKKCETYDYVLVLNPDAFLSPSFLEEAIAFMEREENGRVGAITGALLGYDIDADRPTMLIDSTGISQRWFGRFHDRDQMHPVAELARYKSPEPVNALCGAVMFCRAEAIRQASRGGELFDPEYFMYKEDIDLSWRLRGAGWKVLFHPALWAYHCRGWKGRAKASKAARVMSARNELRLFRKHHSPYLIYSALKWSLVRLVDI